MESYMFNAIGQFFEMFATWFSAFNRIALTADVLASGAHSKATAIVEMSNYEDSVLLQEFRLANPLLVIPPVVPTTPAAPASK